MTQTSPHATAVGLARDVFTAVVGQAYHVRVQLPLALDPGSEPEPDLAVILGARRDFTRAHPTSASLAIEVADSPLWIDRTQKAAIYARAGILDFWIVNLVDGVLEVYRDPTPDAASSLGFGYRRRLTLGPGDPVTPLALPHVTIPVGDLLPS